MANGTQLAFAALNGSDGTVEGTVPTGGSSGNSPYINGSGTVNNAFAGTVTIGANNQQVYTQAHAEGDFALRLILGTTNASIHSYAYAATAGRIVRRFKFTPETLGGSTRVIAARNSSAVAGYWGMGTTGLPFILGASGSAVTGTTAMVAGTEYAVEFATTEGTTTANGVLTSRVFNWASGALVDSITLTGDVGTTPLQVDRIGAASVVSAATQYVIDSYRVHQLASGDVGPTIPPPSAAADSKTGMFRIDMRNSVPGVAGNALTYSITPNSGVFQPTSGYFVGEQPASTAAAVTYTARATETATGQYAELTQTVGTKPYDIPYRIVYGTL